MSKWQQLLKQGFLYNRWHIVSVWLLSIMLCIWYLETLGVLQRLFRLLWPHYIPEFVGLYFLGVTHSTWKLPKSYILLVVFTMFAIIYYMSGWKPVVFIILVPMAATYLTGFYVAEHSLK